MKTKQSEVSAESGGNTKHVNVAKTKQSEVSAESGGNTKHVNVAKGDCIGELKSVPLACRFIFLFISLMVMFLDQLTKHFARHSLEFADPVYVMRFWNWCLDYNQGAAFSLLANQASWSKIVFGVVAVIVAVGLIYYILNRCYSLLTGFSLSFILGGAVGNLIDRIVYGKVTDFIDWHYGAYHWPTFNLADSFITVGVTLLIIASVFASKDEIGK